MFHLRAQYGSLFATILPDGQEIVWRPLTIGEFVEYDKLLKEGKYPPAQIEDEIFEKCVQNKYLVGHINSLNAGIVSTLVSTILEYSGPRSIEELGHILDYNRNIAQEIIHQMVSVICQAFPSYKPEDIYGMSYETFMLRLAQAEDKLIRTGLIKEPIKFFSAQQSENQPAEQKHRTIAEDTLKKFYQQEGIKDTEIKKTTITPHQQNAQSVSKNTQTIITTKDVQEHQFAYTGHEIEDKHILESDMIKETSSLYSGYVDQLRKDGKIIIKTPEERKAEALVRAKENEERVRRINAERSEKDKKLMESLIQKTALKKEKSKNRSGRRK